MVEFYIIVFISHLTYYYSVKVLGGLKMETKLLCCGDEDEEIDFDEDY